MVLGLAFSAWHHRSSSSTAAHGSGTEWRKELRGVPTEIAQLTKDHSQLWQGSRLLQE